MLHPPLQDDCGAHLIHEGFVAACHLSDAALQDGLLGQDACVAFVPHIDRHCRKGLLQLGHESLNPGQVLAVPSVCLLRHSHHEAFHVFSREIASQVSHQLRCLHCCKTAGDNLQRVRHSQTGATDPIVYCQNSSHIINIIKRPSLPLS